MELRISEEAGGLHFASPQEAFRAIQLYLWDSKQGLSISSEQLGKLNMSSVIALDNARLSGFKNRLEENGNASLELGEHIVSSLHSMDLRISQALSKGSILYM